MTASDKIQISRTNAERALERLKQYLHTVPTIYPADIQPITELEAALSSPAQNDAAQALHEIVTNGRWSQSGNSWCISEEVYDLAYNADLFGSSPPQSEEGWVRVTPENPLPDDLKVGDELMTAEQHKIVQLNYNEERRFRYRITAGWIPHDWPATAYRRASGER